MHRSSDPSLLYPSLAKSFVGGLVAIAVILAGIVGINVLTRDKQKSPVSSAVSSSRTSAGPTATSKAGTPTATESEGVAATAKPTAKSGTQPTPKPTPKPAASTAGKPVATAPPAGSSAAVPSAPAVAVKRIPLTVLNSSRIRDLAKSAAGDFRAAGWPVSEADIGNTSYRAQITTVYYLPGQEALARQLMRDVPGVRRMLLRPRVLPRQGLTVVVTREYAA